MIHMLHSPRHRWSTAIARPANGPCWPTAQSSTPCRPCEISLVLGRYADVFQHGEDGEWRIAQDHLLAAGGLKTAKPLPRWHAGRSRDACANAPAMSAFGRRLPFVRATAGQQAQRSIHGSPRSQALSTHHSRHVRYRYAIMGKPMQPARMVDPFANNDIRRWVQAMHYPEPPALRCDVRRCRAASGELVAPQSFPVTMDDGHGSAPSCIGLIPGFAHAVRRRRMVVLRSAHR